jgi:hypothetical protein
MFVLVNEAPESLAKGLLTIKIIKKNVFVMKKMTLKRVRGT